MLIALVNHPARATRAARRASLIVTTAAAPPSPTIIAQMEALGAEIIHVYGLTEIYGPHTVCEWQPQWNELPLDERARLKARQGVGYLIADDVRVVDERDARRSRRRRDDGRGHHARQQRHEGLLRRSRGDRAAFRGGWFHSGDLAVMHPDGYIELRDRKKDIIISGGENISTIEVEQAIISHPAVLEVAVIAVPDDDWGEVPKAFVDAQAGRKPRPKRRSSRFAGTHLARFKARRRSSSASCQDLDRQGPEVRAARAEWAGAGEANQLMGETQAANLHVRNRRHMAWLRHSSLALFGVGLLLVVLGATTGLSATITLIGGLLIVAGVVKVATIRIWELCSSPN